MEPKNEGNRRQEMSIRVVLYLENIAYANLMHRKHFLGTGSTMRDHAFRVASHDLTLTLHACGCHRAYPV